MLPPPPQTTPAPSPLEAAALQLCTQTAASLGWEASPNPERWKALRGQTTACLSLCVATLHEDSRALPLLEAALGALECALGAEQAGTRRFTLAASRLSEQWRTTQKAWGPKAVQRLPDLEALGILGSLGGLRATPWRDEALRIRIATEPSHPRLEKDLAAAVEDHYGPWLTPAEVEPMLIFCGHLARLWRSERSDRTLTQRVRPLGLKQDAHRVWRLAALQGDEHLRTDLTALLDRLDAATLAEQGDLEPVCHLVEALKGGPLSRPSTRLLQRLDAHLTKLRTPRVQRLRIATLLEAWDRVAELLRENLTEASGPEALMAALGAAEAHLREHPDASLLDLGTLKLKAAVRIASSDLAARLETWTALQQAAGHGEEVEALIQLRLSLETPEGPGLPSLLAQLKRWRQLTAYLGAPRPRESAQTLGWRFQAALGLGHEPEAMGWLAAWCTAVLDVPEPPALPGVASALARNQLPAEALRALADRHGAKVMPGQTALLTREPWRLLIALDPDAPQNLLPGKLEEGLRWRWSRLPSGSARRQALEKLIEEGDARLGTTHPLVAEFLMDLADHLELDGIPSAERAVRILEVAPPGHERMLAKALMTLASLSSATDGRRMEQSLRRLMDLLSTLPTLDGEVAQWATDLPPLLLLHLWREQRLDELAAVGPRVTTIVQRADSTGVKSIDLEASLQSLARVARFQSILRTAGVEAPSR